MRHRRRSKLVLLPFSLSCISGSSRSIRIEKQANETELADPTPCAELDDQKKDSKRSDGIIRKLVKSLSHLFAIHSVEEEEEEEEEKEMEIGFPTDVKHVGHIGWDGFNGTSNSSKDWVKGPELLPLNSLSLKQFEAAMATLAAAPPPPVAIVRCSN